MSSPSTMIVPAVGSSSFSSVRPAVDLPQPLSPTSPSVSPRSMWNEMPSTAWTWPDDAREHALVDREMLLQILDFAAAVSCRAPPAGDRRASRRSNGRADASPAAGRSRGTDRWRRPQRGAKVQPFGRCASDGTMPLISVRRDALALILAAASRLRDRAEQAARVGMAGMVEQFVDAASSTLRPAYITTTRSAFSATTPISCVIRIIAVPRRFLQFAHQVEDLRLDGDVQRRGRFIGDQHLRIAGQRHGDHHALPHAAGQLVRIGLRAPLRFGDVTRGAASLPRRPSRPCRDRP